MSTATAATISTTRGDRMVEVAPNRFVQLDLSFEVPKTVFCDVEPVDGHPGMFRLVPHSWEVLEQVTPQLCQKLGMGEDTTTMRRLIRSGFVDGGRPSPRNYTVNISSYFSHLRRCSENPDFWENRKVMAQYKEGYF